jgi:CO dehydrogenase/acetyl-CoA synthase beta subunit
MVDGIRWIYLFFWSNHAFGKPVVSRKCDCCHCLKGETDEEEEEEKEKEEEEEEEERSAAAATVKRYCALMMMNWTPLREIAQGSRNS